MGGILDEVEMLKSPVGIVVLVAIIAGAYYLYRYVMKD
jgi:hypothetical protein